MATWQNSAEATASCQALMEQLHSRWTSDEQRVFLDSRYLERMEHAAHNSHRAHYATMTGRFVIGGATLAPVLTAAGAVANSGFQFWLKIVGIAIGALVAVATATMAAIRPLSTWRTYYDLRIALEQIGWQAEADQQYPWTKFVTAVNDALATHSKSWVATVVDASSSQRGM